MLKFFKSKNPLIVLFYPIIAFIFVYISCKSVDCKFIIPNKPFIYEHFLNLISGHYFKIFYIFFSVLFLSANSIFFNRLIRNLKIVKSFQNLHGFIFLLLSGTLLRFIDILQISISVFFFLITITLSINSLRNKFAAFNFFNAGAALSVASFFWLQIIYFYPVIIFALLVFRSLNFREILTSIIGLLLPFVFFFSIYFFINSNFDIIYNLFLIFNNKTVQFHLNLNVLICGIIFIFILLISTFYILKSYRRSESDTQDFYIFYFLLFLLALVYLIFLNENDISFSILILMSSALPIGVFFTKSSKSLFKEILFDLFLLSIILSQTEIFR